MANKKLIIYRELDGLKVTPESNFNARIRNERKVVDCTELPTADDVRDYFCKYFGCKDSDFIDWSEMNNAY